MKSQIVSFIKLTSRNLICMALFRLFTVLRNHCINVSDCLINELNSGDIDISSYSVLSNSPRFSVAYAKL